MTQAALDERNGLTLPDNVPPECVVDFDLYNLEGTEAGFDEPWRRLRAAAKKCYGDAPPV